MSVNIKTADGKVSIASGTGSGGGGQTIQVVGLPTPTAANLNSVYQYVGLSTDDYVFGHFYQCIEDDENPGTYKWATVYVQPTSTEEDMDLSNYVTKKELSNHAESSIMHCTAGEKINWNSKADGSFESKNVDVINNTYTGINKNIVDSKYLYNVLKSTMSEYETVDDAFKHANNNNSNEKHMSDDEQSLIQRLGVSADGLLTFDNGAVASGSVIISSDSNNIIENKDNGLYATVNLSGYAKSSDLTQYEKTADITVKLADYAKTSDLNAYEKIEDLNTKLADYAKTDDVQDAIDHEHTHDNKTYLDLIGQDENGKMTYNGAVISGSVTTVDGSAIQWSDVNAKPFVSIDPKTLAVNDEQQLTVVGGSGGGSAAVDPDTTNTLKLRANGLYVPPTDLSAYKKHTENEGIFAKISDLDDYIKSADYPSADDVQDTIDVAHKHDNKVYVDLIGQDENGKLTYNGAVVGANVTIEGMDELKWSDVTQKPFISLDPATLAVTDEGALKVIGGGGSGGTGAVSAQAGNSIVLKSDGVYYKAPDLTPYAKTDDLTEYAKKDATFNPTNKDVISSLGKNDAGQLTLDGAVVANSSVTLDPATDNEIKNNADGLYVAPTDLSAYAKSADVSSTYLTQSDATSTYLKQADASTTYLKLSTTATQTGVEDAVSKKHEHTNKAVLDKITSNDDGDFLFDGNPINTNATAITDHITDSTIHTSATEKATWNAKYDKPATGIPASDLSSAVTTDINDRMKTSDWVNSTKGKILGNKIDATQISHTQLKDVGTYSHDEIELLLQNHLSDTSLHNSASLNTITITGSGWNDGTLSHCHTNDDGDLCLDTVVGSDGKEYYYTTEKAKFVSKVYNSGIDDNGWVNINWFGQYSMYYTDVIIKVRVGSTPVPEPETWSEWLDVTLNKSLSGLVGRYIQVELAFTTSDDTRNVVFKNIQMSYGVDVFDEVSAARTRTVDSTTYPNLKLRLDQMDTEAKAIADEVIAARTKGDTSTGTTYASLDERLEAMDGVNNEVVAAHKKTVNGVDTDYTSLKERLDATDTELADIPAADIQAAIDATIAEWAADFAPATT